MKSLSALILITLLLASCTKELQHPESTYVQNVRTSLKGSMQGSDFSALDFSRPVLTKVDSVGLYLFRIPLKGKTLRSDFVLVKTNKEGHVEMGKIIHLEGKSFEHGEGKVKKRLFNGSITISALDRKTVLHSPITNGFIEAFHPNSSARTELVMPSKQAVAEIVVVADYNSGISYSEWYSLQSFFYDAGGGGGDWSGYYGSLDGGGGSYAGGGYSGGAGSIESYNDYGSGGVVLAPPLLIDFENQSGLEPIDVKKYINCFNTIPDAGSTCSIEILADIPVDQDPNMIFDFNSGSPGHTFIQIKKSNGLQSAIQNIGFYPKLGWKPILTNAPIEGKFVDNSQHEFNASFKMSLSPENFRSTITEILYLANFIKYDIDNYNCTDFALDVFNKTRNNKISIDLYHIPGNYPSTGTRTPQGLFNKLKQMKINNHPEASIITISNYKGWVAKSIGPCN